MPLQPLAGGRLAEPVLKQDLLSELTRRRLLAPVQEVAQALHHPRVDLLAAADLRDPGALQKLVIVPLPNA